MLTQICMESCSFPCRPFMNSKAWRHSLISVALALTMLLRRQEELSNCSARASLEPDYLRSYRSNGRARVQSKASPGSGLMAETLKEKTYENELVRELCARGWVKAKTRNTNAK